MNVLKAILIGALFAVLFYAVAEAKPKKHGCPALGAGVEWSRAKCK